jgi:oxygen-independent coproporphyrinogen-3 oxidase
MAVYRLLKVHFATGSESGSEPGRATPFHRILPWGALVGIRPVKLVSNLLEAGASEGEAAREMARKYDVSEEKIKLCTRVLSVQGPILRTCTPGKDALLYVGVPFCRTKCAYCSFPSVAHNRADRFAGPYLEAIKKELLFVAESAYRAGRRIRAVYVGGGTPTALAARELRELLRCAGQACDAAPDEFTVEAGRPDTIDREKLEVIREAASRAKSARVCVNPQTMNRSTLALIGRDHTPDDVSHAFFLARKVGFANINMDVIAGLPGEGTDDFSRTLEAIAGLGPEGLTAHTLSIKRSSRLNEFSGVYAAAYPSAKTAADMQDAARTFAERLGMNPYYLYRQKNTIGNLENVGYAKPGFECLYNIHEMADRVDVLAVGAGAVTKYVDERTGKIERVFNAKNLMEYIERIDEMIERKRVHLWRTA